MKRVLALDMLRGYALVCIMLDHMPLGYLRQVTLTNFALYDAAELFVLLSGFLVGLVWIKVEAEFGLRTAQWRFVRRAGQVWLALVLGGILLALVSRGLLEAGLPHKAIWNRYAEWVIEAPLNYAAVLAVMWLQPNLLDVLALYVVLLASAPVLVPLLLRWPWAFAAGSLALWWVAVPLNAMLPNHRVQGGLLFNPFGWQLLFYSGVAMGAFRHRFMPVLRRHSGWLTAAAAVITLWSLAMVALWRLGPEGKRLADTMWEMVGRVDKWSLAGARFVAIMAASWLVAVPLAGIFAWMAASPPGRALARIGRGGLLAFVACVMLSVLGDAVAGALPRTVPARLAVDLWTIAILWLCADLWLTLRERRARRARPGNPGTRDSMPRGSAS